MLGEFGGGDLKECFGRIDKMIYGEQCDDTAIVNWEGEKGSSRIIKAF